MLVRYPAQAQIGIQPVVITPDNVQQIKEIGTLGRGWVQGLAWSPDNQLFAVASSTSVWLYDANYPDKEPRQLPIEYFQPTEKLKFSPDGLRLATVEDYRFTIWDVATGRMLANIGRSYDETVVSAVVGIGFDKAGHTLVISKSAFEKSYWIEWNNW